MFDKPLILVVDDEKDFAGNVSELLKASGKYETIVCNSAVEALNTIQKNRAFLGFGNHIKLILLDIKMPDMTGLAFLAKLREKYPHEEIGVIMLTAWEDQDKWQKAREGGAAGYLKKPFKEQELMYAVDRFFAGKQRWMVEKTKWELMEKEKGQGTDQQEPEA